MSPKKSPKTSKPTPLFAVLNDTIRGPEAPKKSIAEQAWGTVASDSMCTGPGLTHPAVHVFSFGQVTQSRCFPTLDEATRAMSRWAQEAGEREGYWRGRDAMRKEMLTRITGDDYDD